MTGEGWKLVYRCMLFTCQSWPLLVPWLTELSVGPLMEFSYCSLLCLFSRVTCPAGHGRDCYLDEEEEKNSRGSSRSFLSVTYEFWRLEIWIIILSLSALLQVLGEIQYLPSGIRYTRKIIDLHEGVIHLPFLAFLLDEDHHTHPTQEHFASQTWRGLHEMYIPKSKSSKWPVIKVERLRWPGLCVFKVELFLGCRLRPGIRCVEFWYVSDVDHTQKWALTVIDFEFCQIGHFSLRTRIEIKPIAACLFSPVAISSSVC